MNWQQVTQSFLPLTKEQTSRFAPPREMDLALAAYNRAIRNLNQDSVDIALIALRKLSSNYPEFLEAGLLYGCCLAQDGQLEQAREQLVQIASHPELPEDLAAAAEASIAAVDQDLAQMAELSAANAKTPNGKTPQARPVPQVTLSDLPVRPADALLEKTGRKSRVRMASEKERRDIMRRSDMPQDEATHVVFEKSPMDYLRMALPVVAGLIALILLVYFFVSVLPGLRQSRTNVSAEDRLAYLLAEIEKKAVGDEDWQRLLTDYQTRFDSQPTGAPTTQPTTTAGTTGQTTAATPAVPTETATPTPSPTVTPTLAPSPTTIPTQSPAVLSLRTARDLVSQGLAARETDLIAATESLTQAIQLLETIPAQTTTDDSEQTAGALLAQAKAEYEPIYRRGAEQLRNLAAPLFDRGDYEESLALYLRAYTIYPESYGGGVAYYCGRCYQMLDMPEKARPYFEFVVANFAGRDIAESAAYRLRQLG